MTQKKTVKKAIAKASQKLNARQELFAQYYVKVLNAEKAAKLAGYSEKNARCQASQVLNNPKVRERIEELRTAQLKPVHLDANRVLGMILDVFETSSQKVETRAKTPNGKPVIGMLDPKNAVRSVDMLARHVALYKDSLTINTNAEAAKMLSAAYARVEGLSIENDDSENNET